jgi:hypothetical protein
MENEGELSETKIKSFIVLQIMMSVLNPVETMGEAWRWDGTGLFI